MVLIAPARFAARPRFVVAPTGANTRARAWRISLPLHKNLVAPVAQSAVCREPQQRTRASGSDCRWVCPCHSRRTVRRRRRVATKKSRGNRGETPCLRCPRPSASSSRSKVSRLEADGGWMESKAAPLGTAFFLTSPRSDRSRHLLIAIHPFFRTARQPFINHPPTTLQPRLNHPSCRIQERFHTTISHS